jgi:hypothetical protein
LMSEYQRGDHEVMHCLCLSDHVATCMPIGTEYLCFVHTSAIEEGRLFASAA